MSKQCNSGESRSFSFTALIQFFINVDTIRHDQPLVGQCSTRFSFQRVPIERTFDMWAPKTIVETCVVRSEQNNFERRESKHGYMRIYIDFLLEVVTLKSV